MPNKVWDEINHNDFIAYFIITYYNYLAMLRLKLDQVSKSGHRP